MCGGGECASACVSLCEIKSMGECVCVGVGVFGRVCKFIVGSVWTCVLIADAKSSEKIKMFSPKISFSGAKILSQE